MCSQKILCRISLFTVILLLLLLRILLYATSTLKVLQFSTTYVDYYLSTTYYTTRKIHIFLHTHFCTFKYRVKGSFVAITFATSKLRSRATIFLQDNWVIRKQNAFVSGDWRQKRFSGRVASLGILKPQASGFEN